MSILKKKITKFISKITEVYKPPSNAGKDDANRHDVNLQKTLEAFDDNTFWSSDNDNFIHNYDNLLGQFLSPEILGMVERVAGDFDFDGS